MKIEWFKILIVLLMCGYLACAFMWLNTYKQNAEYHRFEYHDGLVLDTKTGALYEESEFRAKDEPYKVRLYQDPIVK